MEEEAEKIKAMQSEVEKQMNLNASGIGKNSTLCVAYPIPNHSLHLKSSLLSDPQLQFDA